jgi:basic amino acid/polyamine antiporter, APA family
VIAFLAAINVKGTQESTRLNLILAIADLCTQIILVGIGLVLVFNPDTLVNNVHLGVAPSWGDFLLGIAVGMIAYTGIETISNMSEEAKNAPETVPKGVGLTVLAVLGLYALLPLIALSAMPVHHIAGHYTTDLGTKFADDPVLGIVENLGLNAGLTNALRYYVGVLAAVVLLIATNAGLIGVSRLTFSMGHYRQLPERLRQIHPHFRTPYVAILVFSGIAAITLIPGETKLLATLYSFGAMLSFTIAHISVIKLRQRYPNKEREWKPPGSVRAFGFDVPLTAVFGGLGTFAAWIVVMALNPRTLVIGAIWMGLGTAIFLLYRRSLGLSPSQTHKVLLPEPLGVEEIEYKSVLVAFEDDEPFNEQTMVTAVKLAGKRRRAVHVIAIVTVPNHLPLDAPLRPQEEEAQSKIEQAKLIGGLRVSGHLHRVRANQAGHSIAEEARELKATALVMGLRYRNGAPLYGKTLQTVLAERPTRVIVVGEPGGADSTADGGPPVSADVTAPA